MTEITGLENPYPEDIFTEPTHKEWSQVQKLFRDAGLVQDRFFGANGRRVWNNCLKKVQETHLVLNLDDEIDKSYLLGQISLRYDECKYQLRRMKVKDITTDLVNAILKAKEKP